ncbi:MAG TPA: serine/threonine-protein kinase [Gemmatimonadales bacterium]|nr:serine/threonine-protein kinase [Gemmatimonadales bacterium]
MLEAPARFCPRDGSMLVEVGAPTISRQLLDGRYEVIRRLGAGGMSYVYLARDRATGERVAVKVLAPRLSADPTSRQRLEREAACAMRLDHPNLCRILRHGRTADGLLYLVMPCLEGELLSDRERRAGPFPLEPGLELLRQLCRGLHHAHALDVVHRDLKPENVMLVPDPASPLGERAVVLDFGLAKARPAGPELLKLTATGIVLGTPEFMSPEQVRGRPLDGRSDIYSLAVVGFEMFTGRLPFEGQGAQELMVARLRGRPSPLRAFRPDLPSRLEEILDRAMATDPADRFPTMLDLAAALEEVRAARPPQ